MVRSPKFGDRRIPQDPPFSKAVMVFIAISSTVFLCDAEYMENIGIKIKPFFEAFNGLPYIRSRVVINWNFIEMFAPSYLTLNL